MKLVKVFVIFGSVIVIGISLLLTAGLREANILLLVALWLIAIALIAGLVTSVMIYQHVAIRCQNHLVQNRSLQEQQYNHLARQIEQIREALQIKSQNSPLLNKSGALESITERIKLLERRTLGPIENETLAGYRRFRSIETHLNKISAEVKDLHCDRNSSE